MLELAKLAQVVSSPSRVRIVEELMRGPMTASELADKLALSPITIHHHLPWLERAGIIEQAPSLRSGQPGRPTSRYRLSTSPLQINLPPRDFQSLAELLAGVLSSSLGPTALRKVAKELGVKYGKQLGTELLRQSQTNRWTISDFRRHFVEGHMAHRGHAPEIVSEKPRSLHFRLHNCVVLEVARQHPELVCSMDTPLMESLARTTMGATKVEQVACMGKGEPCCEYVVRRGR